MSWNVPATTFQQHIHVQTEIPEASLDTMENDKVPSSLEMRWVGGWREEWRTVQSVRETWNSQDTNHEEITSSGMWRRVVYQISTHVSEELPTSFSEGGGDRIIRNVRTHLPNYKESHKMKHSTTKTLNLKLF